MCESGTSPSVNASVLDLHGAGLGRGASFQKHNATSGANPDPGVSSGSHMLRIIWHALHEKYTYLCSRTQTLKSIVEREANKPMAKKLRRSLHLNKSAKRKGYQYYMSDADKRRLDEYKQRQHHMSMRFGAPFECTPAYV